MSNSAITLANSIADPLPLTPTTLAGVQTVPSQKSITGCHNTVVLSDSTVAALISQQSANAYDLTNQQRIDQGIFDGVVGASLNQLSLPGQFIKPGSAKFIQSKLLEGASLEDAIGNNLLTGTMGIITADQLRTSVQAQTYAVSSSFDNASSALIKSETITGQESDSEIAGLIFAAAIAGPEAISEFLNATGEAIVGVGERVVGAVRGITTTANNIKQLLSGGNFASKIADKFTRGFEGALASVNAVIEGLTSRLSSAILGIKSAISGIANYLKNIIEKSYGTLRANQPNTLAGQTNTAENPSETALLIQNYEIAQQKILEAEEKYYLARKNSKDAPTQENMSALTSAQQNLSSARKQAGTATITYLNTVSSFTSPTDSSDLNSSSSETRSTNDSGLNAIGGTSMFGPTVNRSDTSSSNPVKATLNVLEQGTEVLTGQTRIITDTIESASNAGASAVQAVQQSSSIITNASQSVTAAASAIASFDPVSYVSNFSKGVLGIIGNITASMTSFVGGFSARLTPIFAIGTVNSGSVTSTTSELLGSSIVPKINYDDTTFTADPDEYIKSLTETQNSIVELQFEKQKLTLERNRLAAEIDPYTSSRADLQDIASIDSQIETIEGQIASKETYFLSILAGSNSA